VLVQAIAAGEISSLVDARHVVRESCQMQTYEPRADLDWNGAAQRFATLTATA
jgi:hypothetical protein